MRDVSRSIVRSNRAWGERSCSRTTSTVHPPLRRRERTRRSRAALASIFARHQALRSRSKSWQLRHPCQKQPSMKTTQRRPTKIRSGLPGNRRPARARYPPALRWRNPRRQRAAATRRSGPVRPRLDCIALRRWLGVITSKAATVASSFASCSSSYSSRKPREPFWPHREPLDWMTLSSPYEPAMNTLGPYYEGFCPYGQAALCTFG